METIANPRNGLGLAALILALCGVVFGIIPLTGFVAVLLGIVGLILGLAGRGRVKRGQATNRKTAWSGIILSVGSIVLGIVGISIVFSAVDEFDQDMQEIGEELDQDMAELDAEMAEDEAKWQEWETCSDAIDWDSPTYDSESAKCDAILNN